MLSYVQNFNFGGRYQQKFNAKKHRLCSKKEKELRHLRFNNNREGES
jgi:hypothetical protein